MLKIIEGINVSLKGTLWSSAGDAGDVIHIPANRFMQFHWSTGGGNRREEEDRQRVNMDLNSQLSKYFMKREIHSVHL